MGSGMSGGATGGEGLDRPLLAIEMSQRDGSVAFGVDATTIAVERFASGGSRDDDPLFPAIDRLLRSRSARPCDLGAIAVSVGPGGFTGLRIAVTAAKTMADALDIPVIAVPSALVAADGAMQRDPQGGGWLVALASKRTTSWWTTVVAAGDALQIVGEPAIREASELVAAAPADHPIRTMLADEFVHADALAVARAAGWLIETPRFAAESCWRQGRAMLRRGEFADRVTLAPLYPREPEAVTLWRERHGDEGLPQSANAR
jgi:tRNA threonylcarbamoyladenosine biosynthesis protein TsaB